MAIDQSDRAPDGDVLPQLGALGSSNGVGPTQFHIHLRDTKAGAIDFQRFTVRYTFGHEPLQQYLIALGEDRLQVAPFAYDTRPEAAGGACWSRRRGNKLFATSCATSIRAVCDVCGCV